MQAFLGCDIGKTREENQDSIRAEQFPDGVLAMVCDGMGGMRNGSAASKIAVAAAEEHFRSGYAPDMTGEQLCALLRGAAVQANRKVYESAARNRLRGRMGTTLVGAFARDDLCCIVNVGDSRAYLIPENADAGAIRQITTDHTVVQLLYEQGVISAEERETHERRNELMRAIGVAARVLPDTHTLIPAPGDRLLLCSDGLYGMIPEARLAELVRTVPPEQLAERSIAEANDNGGRDNISVILLTR